MSFAGAQRSVFFHKKYLASFRYFLLYESRLEQAPVSRGTFIVGNGCGLKLEDIVTT